MDAAYKAAWEALQKALDNVTVSKAVYKEALEEIETNIFSRLDTVALELTEEDE